LKKNVFNSVTTIFIFLALTLMIFSTNSIATTRLTLGTSTSGGTYFVYGGGWATTMSKYIEDLEITVQEGGDSSTNVQFIQQGRMELGLISADVSYQAWNGIEWAEGEKYDKFRLMFPMYPSIMHIVTLADSPIKTVYDLEGKRLALGSAGTGSEIKGRLVLDTLGVKPSQISMITGSQQPNALKDHIVDAFIIHAGLPTPAVLDLESTHDIRLVDIPDEAISIINQEFSYIVKGLIPKGTYKNMDHDVTTISNWNFCAASVDLPEDLVYQMVKNTFEHKDELTTIEPNFRFLAAEDINKGLTPVHKGAVKYYKEMGIEIPDHLVID